MKYTREADASIRAELLRVEREMLPVPDEFGEVPIDCFPSHGGLKIRTVGELASDLSRDKRFLLVENARLRKAFREKAVEVHRLRKQLNARSAWTWTLGFAALVFFITTIGLLLIKERI